MIAKKNQLVHQDLVFLREAGIVTDSGVVCDNEETFHGKWRSLRADERIDES
jgi:hypothetical protein